MLFVRRNISNENVSDEATKGNDQISTHYDEKFSSSMRDKKLRCASNHQIKRIFGTRAKIFTCNGYHYVSILSNESDYSLETSNKTSYASKSESHDFSLTHS